MPSAKLRRTLSRVLLVAAAALAASPPVAAQRYPARPGKLNFASPGYGTTLQLATELFATMAGIKLNHVPYKGTGPALTDAIAGQTDLYFSGIAAALPHVRSGRLRAIAVTTTRRVAAARDVPTIAESGLPDYEVVVWYGLAGPRGMSRVIVERINGEAA